MAFRPVIFRVFGLHQFFMFLNYIFMTKLSTSSLFFYSYFYICYFNCFLGGIIFMAGRIFSIGRLIASIIIRYSMIEIIVPAAVMLIIVDIMVEEGLVNSITEIVKGSGLTVRFMFKFFADRMISDCMTFDYDFFQ